MRNRFLLCIGWVLSGFLMSCTKKDSGSSTLPLLVVTPKIEISSRTQLQEIWRESGASGTETSIGHLVGEDAVEHLPLLLGDRNYQDPQIDYGLWGTVPCFYYYGSYDLADGAGTQDFDHLICKESLFQAGLEYNSLHLTEYKSLTEHCSVEVGDVQDSVAPQDDQTNLYKRRYTSCSIAEFDVCTVTETYDQPILGLTDPVDVVVNCHDTGKQLPVDAVVVEDDDVIPTLTKDAILNNVELASANEKNKVLRRGDLTNANIRFFLWSDMYCSYYLGSVERDGETRSVDHLDCHFEEEYSGVNYHTPLRDHQTADMACTKKNREFQATDENSQTQFHQIFECNIDGFELASPDTACVYTKVFNGEDETGQITSTSFECATADDKKLFDVLPPQPISLTKQDISTKDILKALWREDGASSTETSIGHLVGEDAVEYLPLLLGERNYHNPQIDYGLWGNLPCFYYYGSYDLADSAGTQDFDHLICKQSLFQVGLEYQSVSLEDYKSPAEHCSVETGDVQDSAVPQADQTVLYKRRYANCSVAEFDVCTVTETYDAPILGLTDPSEVVVNCHDTGTQLPVGAVIEDDDDDDVAPAFTKDAILNNVELASANEKNKVLRRGDLSNTNIRFFLWSDMYCSYYLGNAEKDGETRSVDHLDCQFEEEYPGVNYHTPLRDHQTADLTCAKKNREFQATDENSQIQFHQVFNCNIDGFEAVSPQTACVYTKVFNGEDETGQIVSTSFECATADDKKLFNALPLQPISLTKQDISTKDILKSLWREDGASSTETSIGHLVGEDAVEHLPLLLGDRNYHNPQIDYGLWGDLPCFYYYGSYDLADSAGTQDFDHLICKESLFQVGLEYQSISLEDYKSPSEHCSVGVGDVQDSAVPQADQTVLYKRRYANCSVAEFDVCTVTETYDAPILGLADPSEVVVNCYDTGKQLPTDVLVEDVVPVLTKDAIVDNVELASDTEKQRVLYRGDLTNTDVRFFLWSDMYCSYYLGDAERSSETRSVDHLDCTFEEEYSKVSYHTVLIDHQMADLTCTKKEEEFQVSDANSQRQFHQTFECNIDGFELASPETACTYTKVFDGTNDEGTLVDSHFECFIADDKKLFGAVEPEDGVRSLIFSDITDLFHSSEALNNNDLYVDTIKTVPSGGGDAPREQTAIGLWNDYYCHYVSIEGVEELDSDDNSDEDGDGDNTRRSLQSLTCSSENFFTGETFPLLEGLTPLESLCSQRSGFEITHVRDLVRTEVSYQCPLIEGLACELKLSFDERLDANAEVDVANAARKKLTCNNYAGQELSYESQDRPYRVSFYQEAQKNQSDTSHAFFYGGKLDSVQLQSLPERIQKAHALVWSEGLNTFFDQGVLVGSYPLPERLTELDFAITLEDLLADFEDPNYVEIPNLERRKLLRKLQGKLGGRDAPGWWPGDEAYPIDNVHRYFGHWDGFDCHYTEYKTYSGTSTSDREAKDLKDLVCFRSIRSAPQVGSSNELAYYSADQEQELTFPVGSVNFVDTDVLPDVTPHLNLKIGGHFGGSFDDLKNYSFYSPLLVSPFELYPLPDPPRFRRESFCNFFLDRYNYDLHFDYTKQADFTTNQRYSNEIGVRLCRIYEAFSEREAELTEDGRICDVSAPRPYCVDVAENNPDVGNLAEAIELEPLTSILVPSYYVYDEERYEDSNTNNDFPSRIHRLKNVEPLITAYETRITIEEELTELFQGAVDAAQAALDEENEKETPDPDEVARLEGLLEAEQAALQTHETLIESLKSNLATEERIRDIVNPLKEEIEQIYTVWDLNGVQSFYPINLGLNGPTSNDFTNYQGDKPPYNSYTHIQRLLMTKPGISLDGDCATKEIVGDTVQRNYRTVDWLPILHLCNQRIETRVKRYPSRYLKSTLGEDGTCHMEDPDDVVLAHQTIVSYECREVNDMTCTLQKVYDGQPTGYSANNDPESFQSDPLRDDDLVDREQQETANDDSDQRTNSVDLDKPDGTGDLLYLLFQCDNGRAPAHGS